MQRCFQLRIHTQHTIILGRRLQRRKRYTWIRGREVRNVRKYSINAIAHRFLPTLFITSIIFWLVAAEDFNAQEYFFQCLLIRPFLVIEGLKQRIAFSKEEGKEKRRDREREVVGESEVHCFQRERREKRRVRDVYGQIHRDNPRAKREREVVWKNYKQLTGTCLKGIFLPVALRSLVPALHHRTFHTSFAQPRSLA